MNYAHTSIFVADDDEEDRELIKEAFDANDFGGSIGFACDGAELLEKLATHIPHFILLDLNMPKLDGIETLKQIRASEKYRNIPIIMLSTSSLARDINSSYLNGCNCYIVKPGSFKEIVNVVACVNNYWLNICKLPTMV